MSEHAPVDPDSLFRTALHDLHVTADARMVPFGGWDMPVQYQSILEEHRAVREAAGIFDVSHMGRLEFAGADAGGFLQRIFTCDIDAIAPGAGKYTLICTNNGGILDDTILYRRDATRFLLVCNAGNRLAVLNWLNEHKRPGEDVAMDDRTLQTVMIALQGPQSPARLAAVCAPAAAPNPAYFHWAEASIGGRPAFVARTGYTGEDGFEIITDAEAGRTLWQRLAGMEVQACGLGARDTLRLEAALPLHGNDISLDTNPVEAGLSWAVAWDKSDFIGAAALRAIRASGPLRRLVGFELTGRGIPRSHQTILHQGHAVGQTTSGGIAPTLKKGIGMGYVEPPAAKLGTALDIDVRGTLLPATVVRRPFYRRAG